jgi:hypothetical protein
MMPKDAPALRLIRLAANEPPKALNSRCVIEAPNSGASVISGSVRGLSTYCTGNPWLDGAGSVTGARFAGKES